MRKDQLQVLWLALGLVIAFSAGVVGISAVWSSVVVESGYAQVRADGTLEWKVCK
ncbi:MAG: hypothetical protein GY794_16140 [bacterium]|nr:hypothetical protein [bacterium]